MNRHFTNRMRNHLRIEHVNINEFSINRTAFMQIDCNDADSIDNLRTCNGARKHIRIDVGFKPVCDVFVCRRSLPLLDSGATHSLMPQSDYHHSTDYSQYPFAIMMIIM